MLHERMQSALFEIYELMDDAGARQEQRGGHDQGARANVTSGRHLDKVAEVIADDLKAGGFKSTEVRWGGSSAKLPGWFRYSKDWDMLALDGRYLLAAIELKSISSSFGKNYNNRAEEAIGSAVDAKYAIDNGQIRYRESPPALGYVLIIRDCEESRRFGRTRDTSFPIDGDPWLSREFSGMSYLDRFHTKCHRLLEGQIYQAVWLVYVDDENSQIREPDPDLSYDAFIGTLLKHFFTVEAMSEDE